MWSISKFFNWNWLIKLRLFLNSPDWRPCRPRGRSRWESRRVAEASSILASPTFAAKFYEKQKWSLINFQDLFHNFFILDLEPAIYEKTFRSSSSWMFRVWANTKYLFSVSSWSILFQSLLTSASCSCSRVFSSSTFSRLRLSKLLCLQVVSVSSFSIRRISLFTRHSCSCSRVCSSWTFSCRSCGKKQFVNI